MQHKILTIDKPTLALEWDYKKNHNLRPENFLAQSNKHVWWKCTLGHSWQAPISRRSSGSNCPYCTGRYVLAGFNDLPTTQPQLINEWDYEKNGELLPEQVSDGSNKKAWWKCDLGHSWYATISSRSAGCGCPYCGNVKALKGFNDLLSAEPELCSQWDYEKNAPLRPDEVTADSIKKVWWKCVRDHSWETCIHVRRMGCECPYCNGKRAIPGETDLETLRPEVAKEWDYEKNEGLHPKNFTLYSNKNVWWKCSLGHSWRNSINHRSNGQGCPYCGNKKVLTGFNDLASLNPLLANQWDYTKNDTLNPEQISVGSNKMVWWLCSRGHSWCANVASRNSGRGCPYCANKKVLKGFNDLLSNDPKLSLEWDYEKNYPLKPDEIITNSNKMIWWKCRLGHSWKAANDARRRGKTCPYCAGKLAIPGETDLKTVCPDLAKEWDYEKNESLHPENVLPQCNTKVWWRCEKKGHSYAATVANRYHGKNCPYCNGKTPMRTRLVM